MQSLLSLMLAAAVLVGCAPGPDKAEMKSDTLLSKALNGPP